MSPSRKISTQTANCLDQLTTPCALRQNGSTGPALPVPLSNNQTFDLAAPFPDSSGKFEEATRYHAAKALLRRQVLVGEVGHGEQLKPEIELAGTRISHAPRSARPWPIWWTRDCWSVTGGAGPS